MINFHLEVTIQEARIAGIKHITDKEHNFATLLILEYCICPAILPKT